MKVFEVFTVVHFLIKNIGNIIVVGWNPFLSKNLLYIYIIYNN